MIEIVFDIADLRAGEQKPQAVLEAIEVVRVENIEPFFGPRHPGVRPAVVIGRDSRRISDGNTPVVTGVGAVYREPYTEAAAFGPQGIADIFQPVVCRIQFRLEYPVETVCVLPAVVRNHRIERDTIGRQIVGKGLVNVIDEILDRHRLALGAVPVVVMQIAPRRLAGRRDIVIQTQFGVFTGGGA